MVITFVKVWLSLAVAQVYQCLKPPHEKYNPSKGETRNAIAAAAKNLKTAAQCHESHGSL